MPGPVHIAYFVHDLNDAAVQRRLDMLAQGGATVTLLGFRRGARLGPIQGAARIVDLGATENGKLAARALSVVTAAVRRHRWAGAVKGADLILARNLESLALATLARPRGVRMAYECLDIHRMMLGGGPVGRVMRAIEKALLRGCDNLVTSSPAFVERYFRPRHGTLPDTLLVENRVLAHEAQAPDAPLAPAQPWRIGWFGIIRCARSLQLLTDLVTALPGVVEVEIRGRPARDVLPDFDEVIAATPGLNYLGPYDRRTDLPRVYAGVHFTWTMDFYEAGGNSDWLLPNRLYEGSLFGPVAIAHAASETGRWFARQHAGLLIHEPVGPALQALLRDMTPARYDAARDAMAAIGRDALVYDPVDCQRLVAALTAASVTEAAPAPQTRLQPEAAV